MESNTIKATIQWLAAKQDTTPSDGGKKKLLQNIIYELQQKSEEIQQIAEAMPEHTEILELVKETKTQTIFKCKFCGVEQKVYKIYFSTVHAKIAAKIFKYCVEHKTHIFDKKDLDLDHTEYGNFPFLKRFGLIYKEKPETGKTYGAPVRRLKEFFEGKWAVAEYSAKDTKSKRQEVSESRIFIKDIRKMEAGFTDGLKPFFVEYEKQQTE